MDKEFESLKDDYISLSITDIQSDIDLYKIAIFDLNEYLNNGNLKPKIIKRLENDIEIYRKLLSYLLKLKQERNLDIL